MFDHETFNLRWSVRWGHTCLDCDYGRDVGSLHVIDYRLWLAAIPFRRFAESPTALRISPADWSR